MLAWCGRQAKYCVLAGALTMSLLVLPIIVVATQEALRAVPSGIRDASYGVGATRCVCQKFV